MIEVLIGILFLLIFCSYIFIAIIAIGSFILSTIMLPFDIIKTFEKK